MRHGPGAARLLPARRPEDQSGTDPGQAHRRRGGLQGCRDPAPRPVARPHRAGPAHPVRQGHHRSRAGRRRRLRLHRLRPARRRGQRAGDRLRPDLHQPGPRPARPGAELARRRAGPGRPGTFVRAELRPAVRRHPQPPHHQGLRARPGADAHRARPGEDHLLRHRLGRLPRFRLRHPVPEPGPAADRRQRAEPERRRLPEPAREELHDRAERRHLLRLGRQVRLGLPPGHHRRPGRGEVLRGPEQPPHRARRRQDRPGGVGRRLRAGRLPPLDLAEPSSSTTTRRR